MYLMFWVPHTGRPVPIFEDIMVAFNTGTMPMKTAIAALLLIGLLALRQIGHFLARVLSKGGMFDVTAHNSFAQLLPAFALAMVAVGLSTSAAMSTVPVVVGSSLIVSTFCGQARKSHAVPAE